MFFITPLSPFVPFGLGLVELPEGIRIISPIDADVDKLNIGMELELVAYQLFNNKEGNDEIQQHCIC